MTVLERAVKDAVRIIQKEVTVEYNNKKQSRKFWRQKKVITTEEWERLRWRNNNIELKFIPNGVVYPFYTETNDVILEKNRNKWLIDYVEFLETTENEEYGASRCEKCPLHPQTQIGTTIIRDILLEVSIGENAKVPCDTINVFRCPYKENTKLLFTIKEIWQTLHNALAYSHSLPLTKDFAIDFQTKRVDRFSYWSSQHYLRYTVNEWLTKMNSPIIIVKEIKDLYEVLTDSEKMQIVLNQYIESVEDSEYYGITKESKEIADTYRNTSEIIIKFFGTIKDLIKFENMRGVYDCTFEEEQKRKQEKIEYKKLHGNMPKMRKGHSCESCLDDGNYICTKCYKRTCQNHWKNHLCSHTIATHQN